VERADAAAEVYEPKSVVLFFFHFLARLKKMFVTLLKKLFFCSAATRVKKLRWFHVKFVSR
jgi:hypothetical protein